MRKVFPLAVLSFALTPNMVRAQPQSESCVLQKHIYVCSWQTFRTRFAEAHTVSLEAQPLDRATEGQMRHLVEALGKSLAAPGQPGDMIFRVAPANASGIEIGPSDQPLASLQIYARGPEGGRGALLWVETFLGQADRPYPMVVTALTEQFQERFHRHGK